MAIPRLPDNNQIYDPPQPPKPPVYPGGSTGPAGPPKPPKGKVVSGTSVPYQPGQTATAPGQNSVSASQLLPPGVGLGSGQPNQTYFPGYAPSAGSPIPKYIVRNGAYVLNPAWQNMHGGGMPNNYGEWQSQFGLSFPGGMGPLPPDDYKLPEVYMPDLNDLLPNRNNMTLLPENTNLPQPENVTDGSGQESWVPSWTFPSYSPSGSRGGGGARNPGSTRQRVAQRVLSWNIKE